MYDQTQNDPCYRGRFDNENHFGRGERGLLRSISSRARSELLCAFVMNEPSTIASFAVDSRRTVSLLRRKPRKKPVTRTGLFLGRGERTRTFDLTVPNRARYQLRHTPIGEYLDDYTPI